MRINLIPPSLLADQHLIAEYREIKMLPKCALRSLNSKKGLLKEKISKTYVLNTGHGYFFYDKLLFIEKRFNMILLVMQKRGFATNHNTLPQVALPEYLYNDYVPTNDEIYISLCRIIFRINEKPHWYLFNRKNINWDTYYDQYLLLIDKPYPVLENYEETMSLQEEKMTEDKDFYNF